MTRHPYARDAYADSLVHIGKAVSVPEWGCSVLIRDAGSGFKDATGCYPIAVVAEDADLAGGLERLRKLGLVSCTLTVDGVHRPSLAELEGAFTLVKPFKAHFAVKAREPVLAFSKHHRYAIRRAERIVRTGILDLASGCDEWMSLYATLSERHGLRDIHLFSRDHILAIGRMAGFTAIGGWIEDRLVCAHIWAHHQGGVHSHLGASSVEGYAAGAAYAVYAASLEYFAEAELINLGGAPDNSQGGLAQFKAGFANTTLLSHICGAVLDPCSYGGLADFQSPSQAANFFPAYRGKG